MAVAKIMSLESKDQKSVYIKLYKTSATKVKSLLIVQYEDGELIKYCRPPWRPGPTIDSSVLY
jgi:hypothetical protein